MSFDWCSQKALQHGTLLTVTIVEIHMLILEVCLIQLSIKFVKSFRFNLKLSDLKLCIS